LTALLLRHGAGLLAPYYGPKQEEFARALQTEAAAARFVLKHYRVVRASQGEEVGLKYGSKDPTRPLGQLNSLDLPHGIRDKPLRKLVEAFPNLGELLKSKTKEEIRLEGFHPSGGEELKSTERVLWRDSEGSYRFGRVDVLGPADDFIEVGLEEPELLKQLTCLSSEERTLGIEVLYEPEARLLKAGDEAYLPTNQPRHYHERLQHVILPLRPGETGRYVFVLVTRSSGEKNVAGVWGLTVKREGDEAIYSPYDNGMLYEAQDYSWKEITARPKESNSDSSQRGG
jgi:hypothetical protein